MKKIFEDMIPNNRRSVRNIAVPDRSNTKRLNVPVEPFSSTTEGTRVSSQENNTSSPKSIASLYGGQSMHEGIKDMNDPVPLKRSNFEQSNWRNATSSAEESGQSTLGDHVNRNGKNLSRRRGILIWIIFFILLFVVGILILWTFAFASVSIDVTPLSKEINLNKVTFVGTKDGGTAEVPFTIVTLTNEGIKKVPPSGQRQVERVATGKVVLYNAYSNSPQRLVRNTRLETPDGLVFRVADSVTIPGKTIQAGKETPGSVTVSVMADTPGDKGNIKLSDFSIPGFKGDPRYTKLYGRSAEVFSGGYIGVEKVVSDDILHSAQKQVQIDTLSGLVDQVKKKLGTDQVFYDSGVYSETEMEPTGEDGGMVTVKEKVTIYAVIFSRADLAKYIAQTNILHFDGSAVTLDNPKDLQFTIVNKDQVRPWIDPSFNFILDGKTKITLVFDEDKLKQSLAGKPKQSFYVLLPTFPSISTATPHFNPAWKSDFPSNIKDIILRKN
jgi:hypothetical protein